MCFKIFFFFGGGGGGGGGKEVGLCSFLGKFGVLIDKHCCQGFGKGFLRVSRILFEILVCFHGNPICCSVVDNSTWK